MDGASRFQFEWAMIVARPASSSGHCGRVCPLKPFAEHLHIFVFDPECPSSLTAASTIFAARAGAAVALADVMQTARPASADGILLVAAVDHVASACTVALRSSSSQTRRHASR